MHTISCPWDPGHGERMGKSLKRERYGHLSIDQVIFIVHTLHINPENKRQSCLCRLNGNFATLIRALLVQSVKLVNGKASESCQISSLLMKAICETGTHPVSSKSTVFEHFYKQYKQRQWNTRGMNCTLMKSSSVRRSSSFSVGAVYFSGTYCTRSSTYASRERAWMDTQKTSTYAPSD